MGPRPHKTKIVCTIGPATSGESALEELIRAGMDVARLNFSHGDFATHETLVGRLRAASEAVGRRIAVLADLPGPKIRVGELAVEPLHLTRDATLALTTERVLGHEGRVTVEFDHLAEVVNPGDLLFLKDGLIELAVQSVGAGEVYCRVVVGGELRSRAGVNLPGVDLGIGALTDRDRECLAFALSQGVDAVALSFVATAADVRAVRKAAAELGHRPFVIAKIERAVALAHIEEILAEADGIMVARGDLGVEISLQRIAVVQKQLIARAGRRARPVITATQMLESMVRNPRPTRAEATDVANAILDGTDCVMLSAESAIGEYPVEAAKMLAGIARATEPHRRAAPAQALRNVAAGGDPDGSDPECLEGTDAGNDGEPGLADLIALSVRETATRALPATILVPTQSGAMARNVARFRLPSWVTAVSPSEATCRELQFSYGVTAARESPLPEDWNAYAREWLGSHGPGGGLVILTAGPSPRHPEGNHRMELIDLR